jgi:hypothetical protein
MYRSDRWHLRDRSAAPRKPKEQDKVVQPDNGDPQDSDRNELSVSAGWPEEPEPVNPGEGTRADRLRMLQDMRGVWDAFNAARRAQVEAEMQAAHERQAEVTEYWDRHRARVKTRWENRTGRRGETTVADISEIAAQWHPDNSLSPERVSATAQKHGAPSPYLWHCPLGLGHTPWPAWPKDRTQKGSGCPACRKLVKLSDIPTLAEQYRGPQPPGEITYGVNDEVPWICRTWALDPTTGQWRRVEHQFTAVIKDRSQQGHGCLVCAGYVIDDTNSLATWFPELADQLDDPHLDPRQLATSTHNVSRKALREEGNPGGVYATHLWRCPHGHQWPSTINNRVQGGADCPDCSTSGISKEQVRLVAELAWLLDLVEPDRPDLRLPDGVPNFASHKITIPLHLKPAHWRYKDVEIDALLRLPADDIVVGLEYDGVYHHSNELRERSGHEAEKSQVLKEAGKVATVVHVRVGVLPPLEPPSAMPVSVPEKATSYEQERAVAAAVEARYPGNIPKLADYLASGRALGQAQADAYILAIWGQLRPPRPKPQRTTPPRQRSLTATNPGPNSLLTPIGDPYRNPKRPTEVLRDYRCACGNIEIVTAVQSQVTSGNTRSCGCLRDEIRRQKRPAISRAETQAAREWVRETGAVIGENGRLPDRIIASYRLHLAGHGNILGEDGFLGEQHVRGWAQTNHRPLRARGQLPSKLWLEFADDYLTRHEGTDVNGCSTTGGE